MEVVQLVGLRSFRSEGSVGEEDGDGVRLLDIELN